jgi:hypothetical protein
MFALINTKGANHIAIHIPHEGADRTIPALVGMLEQNAVFINKGYCGIETTKPEMSIQLGNRITLENSDEELAVVAPGQVAILDESFVHDTPEVRLSYRKGIKRKDIEIQRLLTELAHVKQQLTDLQDRINSAADGDEP